MFTSMFYLYEVAVYAALPFFVLGLVLSAVWLIKKVQTFEQYVLVTVLAPNGEHVVRRLLARGRRSSGVNRYCNDLVTVFWRDDSPNVLRFRGVHNSPEKGEKNAIAAYLEPIPWRGAMYPAPLKKVGEVVE